MKKTVRVFSSFQEAEAADLEEWLALSPQERFAIGERMRLEAFGDVQPRFPRLLRLVERQGGEVPDA